MGPTFILASSEKRIPFCPYRESNNYSSVVQQEARSLYWLCYHGTLVDKITFWIIKLFMPLSISRSSTMLIFIQSSYIPTCLGDGHSQGRHLIERLKNKRPWCHLLFDFTSYVLYMLRTLIYPSPGAWDCAVELPHRSFCSLLQRTKNKTIDVVIQQHSRKLLVMDILMSATCWARKMWNKITSDINLVFYSSTVTMMHGPINIRFT